MGGTALAWALDRLRSPRWRHTGTALIGVLAAVAVFTEDSQRVRELFKGEIHEWNAFHYVLGSKYFDELGYTNFYDGMVLADADADRRFSRFKNMRDLRTNRRAPVKKILARAEANDLRADFTDERWEELKGDLRAMQSHRSARRWEGPLNDLGFHPSPAWLVVHRPLLNAVDIQQPWVLAALCSSDIWLMIGAIVALGWAFGWRRAALAAMWWHLYFGNTGILVGGYFHFDWLFWTVLAVCLLKKDRWLLAGIVLAYPAMMRGFPGLLALGPGVLLVRALILRRRPQRRQVAFVVALVLSCGLLVGLGSTTARGFGAWTEWRSKIGLHADTHPTGRARVGLSYLFAHDVKRDGWEPTVEERRAALDRRHVTIRVTKVVLLALLVAAMARRRPQDAVVLGLGVMLVALTMSRYYYSVLALLLTLNALDTRRIGNLVVALAMFGGLVLFYVSDDATLIWRYHHFNLWVFGIVGALCALFMVRDGRALWRRRRRRLSSARTA